MTPLLTLKQVAEYLGAHEMSVYRWAKGKKIPMFKVGGRWRARKEDIQAMAPRPKIDKTLGPKMSYKQGMRTGKRK